MRRPLSTALTAGLLALAASCATSLSNDPSGAREPGPGESGETLPAPTQPGEHHQAMQVLAGDWNLELVDFSDGGDGRVVARGTGEIRSELGGRYLVWKTAVDSGDGERHGAGLLGYDLLNKTYEFLWVSGRTTGMPIARGEGVLMGRGIDLNIQVRDPRTGRIAVGRTLLRATDRDHFVVENYALDVGGELRVRQRTSYSRR